MKENGNGTFHGVGYEKLDLVRTSTHIDRWESDGKGSLIINARKDSGSYSRSTTHFTLNTVVQDHGSNKFSEGKFAVIGNLGETSKENIVSGVSSVDTWMLPTNGKMKIPGATLVAPDNAEIPERFNGLNLVRYPAHEDVSINYKNLSTAIEGELTKRGSPVFEADLYGWKGKPIVSEKDQLGISNWIGSDTILPGVHSGSADARMESMISDVLKLKKYTQEDNFHVNDIKPTQQLDEAEYFFKKSLPEAHPKAQAMYKEKFNKAFEGTRVEVEKWRDKHYQREPVSKVPEGFPLPNGSSTAIPPPIPSNVIPLTPSGNVPGMPPIPGTSIPPPIPTNMPVDTSLDMLGKFSEWKPKRFSDGLTPHQSKDIMDVYKKQGGKVAQDALKQVYNIGINTNHQGIDSTKQSGVNTKTSTINNHKKVHKDVEENSVKNFFGANRLKGFDTETTGLDTTNTKLSKRDRIWQVGLAIEGIGGVEEHTNPFFTSKADGSIEQSNKMSRPYLESSLKHGNGKFSQTAFEQGNFNEFIGLYEKGGLSTLDDSIKNTLGTVDSKDVVVLQNMNFENRMLKSSLEQGILSKDVYEDIASRMMTVDLNKDGSVNTLLQRPAKVQELMRKADMTYHTEYLNNLSEDSFQIYRQTVNSAIAEYSTIINDNKRVGAVAVELQDLSKAFLANAANRGLIDKSTSTLGLNIDFLSNAILDRPEKHTALQDSKDTIDLFKKMWSMNSELDSGAELSEKTKETLGKIKAQQPDEINKRFISSVKSVINDFKEKSYTNIGDKYSWYNPEVTLAQKSENGVEKIKLDQISTTSKKANYSLPEALNNVHSRYSRFANNVNSFDREAFTQGIVNDFNSGVDYSNLHSKVDKFKLPENNSTIGGTPNILADSLENKVKESSNIWDNKTSLFGKEMKVKTKASILGGIGAGLALMAFTPTPTPTPDRSDNVSSQFYDEQYLGTAFVDFKERNKHYMM